MKHNLKITLILISMFIITQLIGLFVIYSYQPVTKQVEINGTLQNITSNNLPYGMQPPSGLNKDVSFISIIISFIFAILFVFLLTKLKAALFMRIWFFTVVIIVLGISFNSFFLTTNLLQDTISFSIFENIPFSWILAIVFALPLAIYKVFKKNLIVHNLTELFIYPGIAVVFIPLLNIVSVIILLIIISVYDIWAVWHSGFMQKMAQFQIQEMKVFAGFFLPYAKKKDAKIIKESKQIKSKSLSSKTKDVKVSVAILGGGDVVFPIITSGVIFYSLGLIPAIIVSLCASIALFLLFAFAQKGKFYPAMPFISSGLFIGIALSYLVNFFL